MSEVKVILAKNAGFCFGVQRAVDQVYEQIAKSKKKVFTYGPIVHNDEVVNDLKRKGVEVISSPEDLKNLHEAVVIIRAHGVGREVYSLLDREGITLVDATCPFVRKIHRIVQEQQKLGRRVILAGNAKHPEVQGICSWGNGKVTVVENLSDADQMVISDGEKLSLVAQTTFNYNKFQELVENFAKKGYDINVINTICNATQERQVEAKRIASSVDVMLVIGGRHSSNSQKLYEICQRECKNTYFIQTPGDFNPECVNSVRSVGITAGASTPKQIIEEVHTSVRIKF